MRGSVPAESALSTQDARANPASSLYDSSVLIYAFNKNDCIYPSLRVIPFHNPTLHHNVVCTDSPLAAPVVTPVKEATSGRAHVINHSAIKALCEYSPIPHQQAEYLGVLLDAGRLRATLTESRGIPAPGSLQAASGGDGDSFDHHANFGSHGGCSLRGATRIIAYTSPAEVVYLPSFRSQEAQTTSGDHPLLSGGQPQILVVLRASAEGVSTGASDLLHHGLHRRIRDRMGEPA